jgi:hypothetical protein
MWDYKPCALKGMKLPDGKIYSCPERCSIPRWVYFLTLLDYLVFFFRTVIKPTKPTPAIRGFALRHAVSASGFVVNCTFTGLLQERIICAG